MSITMVRYKVKPDRVDENKGLIEKVFAHLDQSRPPGLRYASFRMEDGVSFLHIAVRESDEGEHPLSGTPAFQAFVAQIEDRCDEPPLAVELERIGGYRFFGG